MNRRGYLMLCVGALSGGCLGLSGPSKKEIAWLRLKNNRGKARDLEVFIKRSDEEVFRETYQLGTTPEHATIGVEDPVEGPGRYSLYFDIGGQLVQLYHSELADATIGEPCVGIQFTLYEQRTVGFEYEAVQEC